MAVWRAVRRSLVLPPLLAIGWGCASTRPVDGTVREPGLRLKAAIGDRPVTVAGGPKSSIVDEPPTARGSAGRVAGRVVDDRGDPVPNARVRVADGGRSAGRIVEAKTDRSGGFTLHGLHADTDYTLIAEYEGRDGPTTGRVSVTAPETGIEIALNATETPTDRRQARKAAATPSRSISQRRSIDDDDPEPSAVVRPYRPQAEDTPAGSDVESIDDLAEAASTSGETGHATLYGWRKTRGSSSSVEPIAVATVPIGDDSARRASNERGDDRPVTHPTRPIRDRASIEVDEDNEGDNPLPAAIERPGSKATRVSARPRGGGTGTEAAPDDPRPRSRPGRDLSQSETKPGPGRVVPGALAFATVAPPSGPAPRPRPMAVEPPPADPAPDVDPFGPVAPAPVTTWADLSTSWDTLAVSDPAPEQVKYASPHSSSDRAETRGRAVAATRTGKGSYPAETCKYDPQRMRVLDFRLPGLDGKAVTLRDVDADFILIDFWGTWCRPCLGSVPHLVELQQRMGNKTLAVLGVACEDGPPSASARHVADVADRLGINYRVLLSGRDGTSPIQEAMHVQAYPTMVLLDRQGRIVWKETGATMATLARLDRALDSGIRAAQTDRARR